MSSKKYIQFSVEEFAKMCIKPNGKHLSTSAIRYWTEQGQEYFQQKSIEYCGKPYRFVRGVSPASQIFIIPIGESEKTELEIPLNLDGKQKRPFDIDPDDFSLGDDANGILLDIRDSLRDLKLESQIQYEGFKALRPNVEKVDGGAAVGAVLIKTLPLLIPLVSTLIEKYLEKRDKDSDKVFDMFSKGMVIGKRMTETAQEVLEPEEETGKLIQDLIQSFGLAEQLGKQFQKQKNPISPKPIRVSGDEDQDDGT